LTCLLTLLLLLLLLLLLGDYPESLKTCAKDLLPSFTAEESALLKGSLDFLGINFYTGK
jgi:beta-glucosidase